jgi:hypothetical protein
MALYVVTAVRFDNSGEVESVRWARADGAANKLEEQFNDVGVDRVVEAFDRGDVVELRFETLHGWVSGGRILRKVLPEGIENVIEERGDEGRTLRDMPTF